MTGLGLASAMGMITGLGLFLVVMGARRGTVRLGDALALLDGASAVPVDSPQGESSGGLEAAGWWLHRRLRLPVSARQQRLLLMQDRSIGDFFAERFILALTGFTLPGLWVALQYLLGYPTGMMPLAACLLSAVVGYFIADLRLSRHAVTMQRSTTESLHTFFDLVALERLANQSATQAVASAAEISDAPLFRRISAGLERARMEQSAPWQELHRIAEEWRVPELADFADVMKLEEQGAALADVLQARVRELRDAHLAAQRSSAQEATEGLAIWMTIPALLLGVTFVIPPLLRLTGM